MPTEETLKSWNFLRDYRKHREDFIRQAKVTYSVAKQLFGTPPDQDECKILYGTALYESPFYIDMARQKKFLPPVCYEAFARLLAEYVVDKHWKDIQAP